MAKFAIVTDLNRCVGCVACSASCKTVNNVQIGNFWTRVLRVGPTPKYEGAVTPDTEMYFLPIQCQHCDNPECVTVCPTGASKKMDNGTVQIDKEACIGCQACIGVCPYGVRYMNEVDGVAEKCTLCEQQVEQGVLPQCVSQCVGRAKFFGDLEKGIESFEGPGIYEMIAPDGRYMNENVSYDECMASRINIMDVVNPFTDADVHYLENVGNDPAFPYILRNHTWQGNE